MVRFKSFSSSWVRDALLLFGALLVLFVAIGFEDWDQQRRVFNIHEYYSKTIESHCLGREKGCSSRLRTLLSACIESSKSYGFRGTINFSNEKIDSCFKRSLNGRR